MAGQEGRGGISGRRFRSKTNYQNKGFRKSFFNASGLNWTQIGQIEVLAKIGSELESMMALGHILDLAARR